MSSEQAPPSFPASSQPRGRKPAAASTKVIGRQARQSRQLIGDLLDVVRINHGKTALRKQPVDLADVLDRAIETMRPAITERRHQFAADYPRGGKLLLEGDAVRLEQIVVNLLANAVTCTPCGGRLALRAMRAGGDLSLAIDDSRILELFTQGERNGTETRDGLGIRLAIVQKLAHLHGGNVSAASAGPGRGTTFIVRLPALADASPDQASVDGKDEMAFVEKAGAVVRNGVEESRGDSSDVASTSTGSFDCAPPARPPALRSG